MPPSAPAKIGMSVFQRRVTGGGTRSAPPLNQPIKLDDIRQRKQDAKDIAELTPEPPMTAEQELDYHLGIAEWNPGYKYAHLMKKYKITKNTASAFSLFIEEQRRMPTNRHVPYDQAFSAFGPKWEALSETEREPYKLQAMSKRGLDAAMGKGKTRAGKDEDGNPVKRTNQEYLEWYRQEYGIEELSGWDQVRLYYPPEHSGMRPLRGRDHYEDLRLVRALYVILEHEERLVEEKMLADIECYLKPDNYLTKRIYVLNCVPVVEHLAPSMRVHQPLELYLTCFTLAEGLGSVAYHRHIRAGEGLAQEDGTCLQVIEEAWKQAHLRHNLAYIGFNPTEQGLRFRILDLEEHYDGWDIYAEKTIQMTDNYHQVYLTIHEILAEDADEAGNLPPLFTHLKDVEMVGNCLEWLKRMVLPDDVEDGHRTSTDGVVPDVKFRLFSLEHLVWQIGEMVGKPFTEEAIEKTMTDDRFSLYPFKCSYHETRVKARPVCARAVVLSDIFKMFHLLLEPCGITPGQFHLPHIIGGHSH